MQISELQNEFINLLVHDKLIKLGKTHFSKLGIDLDSFFYKEWFVIIQCLYWLRLEELEKNPQYFEGSTYDGYNPINQWIYSKVLKSNIMSCVAKIINYLDTKRSIEREESNLKILAKEFRITELLDEYTDIINNKHELINKVYELDDNIFYLENEYIVYKGYKFKIDSRIQYLINKCDVKTVLRMLLRYVGLGIDAMHCSLPYELYKYFYDTYNIRGEGYSSPLNSKLIEFGDTKICTAFADTDKCFGSIGRFSKDKLIKNSGFNWTVNPPYVMSIVQYSFNEICAAIDEIDRDDFLVIYLIPKAKEDDRFYHDTIKQHEYVQKCIEPYVGTHYMNCNGTLVHMVGTVNAMFFISKNKKYKNINETELMITWNDKNNDPKKGQSDFIKPSKASDIDLFDYKVVIDDTSKIQIRTDLPKSMREYINEKIEKHIAKQKGGDVYRYKYEKYKEKFEKHKCLHS
jgi:hypothetical protein